jgi:gliding motility-associated lipoprotein GldH
MINQRMIKKTRVAFIVILFVLLSSCTSDFLYLEEKQFDGQTWSISDTCEFIYNSQDSLNEYDVVLDVRVTDEYSYRNIIYIVQTQDPENNITKDTLDMVLQLKDGVWAAEYSGNILTASGIVQKRYFNFKGDYKYKVYHNHRKEVLDNVVSFGLGIAKSKAEGE